MSYIYQKVYKYKRYPHFDNKVHWRTVKGNVETVNLSYLGSTIVGPEAGGYVIVALLAFALGVIGTILIQKKKGIESENTINENEK